MAKEKQIPKVVDGEPVPDVRRREMRTYDAMVDDAMEQIGGKLNLDLVEDRQRLSAFLYQFVQCVAHDVEWAYRRATDTALDQANQLMRDPDRYKNQRRRTKAQKEKYLQDRAVERAAFEAREQARKENVKQLADEGRLVAWPGYVLNIPCCTGENDPPKKPDGDGA